MILEVNGLKKSFRLKEQTISAVNDVSFCIKDKECVGLIGESGSGKSTVANLISGFEIPDKGEIVFDGRSLPKNFSSESQLKRRGMQMVFQQPISSFSPKMTVIESVCEGLRYIEKTQLNEMTERAAEALEMVNIRGAYFNKRCSEISGGECQRVAIARAIVSKPKLILNDEVTSSLDVSVQSQILHLLHDLKNSMGISYLFISHDLAVVAGICDRVLVMHNGKIVEEGATEQVLKNPRDEYTKQLISAVLTL